MNRKATLGPQTMIFVFLICLILMIAGIVWGISAFFGTTYDFRTVDTTLLTTRIENCLTQNDIQFQNKEQFEKQFYRECKINKNVTDQFFFIHIDFGSDASYDAGPGDRTQCALSEKNENFPKCSIARIEEKNIFIQTGSNQKSRGETI
jgi:hypothetical protein